MTNDEHARPTKQEQLFDPNTKTPTHAERAMTMMQPINRGTLCTIGEGGFPYGSLVTFALHGSSPVFLISQLAEHTKNLQKDPRASLLAAEHHPGDPLANGRITLIGKCEPNSDPKIRERFLSVHETAKYYVDFKDFAFYQLKVESMRYVGGYGRMSWIDLPAWQDATPDPLAAHQKDIVEHMNEDHADAMLLYCKAFSLTNDVSKAIMTSVDRYGFDLSVTTSKGPNHIRLAFQKEVSTPDETRAEMVRMVKEARAKLNHA